MSTTTLTLPFDPASSDPARATLFRSFRRPISAVIAYEERRKDLDRKTIRYDRPNRSRRND